MEVLRKMWIIYFFIMYIIKTNNVFICIIENFITIHTLSLRCLLFVGESTVSFNTFGVRVCEPICHQWRFLLQSGRGQQNKHSLRHLCWHGSKRYQQKLIDKGWNFAEKRQHQVSVLSRSLTVWFCWGLLQFFSVILQ